MAIDRYTWKRFFSPREARLTLDHDGYLGDPERTGGFYNNSLVTLADVCEVPCVVVLGEAGTGKSTELEIEHERAVAEGRLVQPADLGSYSSEETLVRDVFAVLNPERETVLFLDGLDECLVPSAPATLLRELKRIGSANLRVRISCRTGDWPKLLDQGLTALYGDDKVKVLEIAPLRRADVEAAATSRGVSVADFFQAVERREAQPLAMKPITLEFLLGQFERTGSLPATNMELYRAGCRELCQERNLTRLATQTVGDLGTDERFTIARRVAAALMYCGKPAVSLDPTAEFAADNDRPLLPSEVVGTERGQAGLLRIAEAHVREVVASTGLFTGAGAGLFVLAHRSYAEFLAADFVCEHRLTLAQIRSLVMHHDLRTRVVPQLRGVAGWLCTMREDLRMALLDSDPETLLACDLASAPEELRASVTASVLRHTEEGTFFDVEWALLRNYRKLAHSKLPDQLREGVRDRNRSAQVRILAMDIVDVTGMVDVLHDDLAGIALDQNETYSVRTNAAHVLVHGGDPGKLDCLQPLVFGVAADETDDLKACALKALWPDRLGTAQPFEVITAPRSEHHIGSYHMFLRSELPSRLRADHLDGAIAWLDRNRLPISHADALGGVADTILRFAWNHMDDSNVRRSVARCIYGRAQSHEELLPGSQSVLKPEPSPIDADEAGRRRLVEGIVVECEFSRAETYRLYGSRPPLVRAEDFSWLLTSARAASPEHKSRWAYLVREAFEKDMQAEAVDQIVVAAQADAVIAGEFGDWLGAVDRDSPRAKELRDQQQRIRNAIEGIARNTAVPIRPNPREQIEHWLQQAETDPFDSWRALVRVLTLEESSRYFGDPFQSDPTSLPGWRDAAPTTRERLVAVARRFIEKDEAETDEWLGTDEVSHSALAGYQALRLLFEVDRTFIDQLPGNKWEPWSPILIGHPSNDAGEAHRFLIARTYRANPERFRAALIRFVKAQDERYKRVFQLDRLSNIEAPELGAALLELAAGRTLSPTGTADMLREAMRRRTQGAIEWALEPFRAAAGAFSDAETRARTIAVACVILHDESAASWPVMRALFERDVEFGRAVIDDVSEHRAIEEGATVAKNLSPAQVAELYIWIERHYAAAGGRSGDSRHQNVKDFKDSLLRYLRNCGLPGSAEAIDAIRREFPDREDLAWGRFVAERATLEHTWRPCRRSDLFELARNAERRIVDGGADLLELVIVSLSRLNERLGGDGQEAAFLWDETAKRPKKEIPVAAYIERHLRDDLRGRGLVINREVEIRRGLGGERGARTDIHVQAVRAVGGGDPEVVTVTIEVKGCWNAELLTAMKTQLCESYLRDQSRHGVYVVAWFNCAMWDSEDSRRAAAHRHDFQELRERLVDQAAELSVGGVVVRPCVLDASLR